MLFSLLGIRWPARSGALPESSCRRSPISAIFRPAWQVQNAERQVGRASAQFFAAFEFYAKNCTNFLFELGCFHFQIKSDCFVADINVVLRKG
jgi:hypothetical protein